MSSSNNTRKILTVAVFPIIIIALIALIVSSVMKPVNFNKQTDYRKSVAVQRLKDIRTLQVAFKGVEGRFTGSIDTLVDFYNNGNMVIVMQVGSMDDSSAVNHTEAVKKQYPWLKGAALNQKLYEQYRAGDTKLVFSVETKIPVRDTLFNDQAAFCADSLRTIPFSGGEKVQMEAVVKSVSGVQVPLFEAKMPYKSLLKGLDNQLRINLDAEMRDMNRYEGLQVGSITAPNNNAGNWE